MTKQLVKVVVPVYKTELSDTEEKSLRRCLDVLDGYPIVLAQPEGLDTSAILGRSASITTECFPREYFSGVAGYNRLMLSLFFYERFADCEYILIHQLDAFVFRDELTEWCGKGYAYIGAPWIATPRGFVGAFQNIFKSRAKKRRELIFNRSGNGGFSLRKTSSFLSIAENHSSSIAGYLAPGGDRIFPKAYEDVFWSMEAPKLDARFTIPDYRIALKFSMDRRPKAALRMNNGELPFGCHGYDKPNVKDFWMPIIDKALSE